MNFPWLAIFQNINFYLRSKCKLVGMHPFKIQDDPVIILSHRIFKKNILVYISFKTASHDDIQILVAVFIHVSKPNGMPFLNIAKSTCVSYICKYTSLFI